MVVEPAAEKPERKRYIPDVAPIAPTNGGTWAKKDQSSSSPKKPVYGRLPSGKHVFPDFLVEHAITRASDNYDYKTLAALRDQMDQILNPELRLKLLLALNWYDETAIPDAIRFLKDEDERVVAAASDIVSTRISSEQSVVRRGQYYSEALKLMKDSPDREILIDTLKGERKSLCIHLMNELEKQGKEDPSLWNALKEVYEYQFDRPYVSHIDSLLHYRPGLDD